MKVYIMDYHLMYDFFSSINIEDPDQCVHLFYIWVTPK